MRTLQQTAFAAAVLAHHAFAYYNVINTKRVTPNENLFDISVKWSQSYHIHSIELKNAIDQSITCDFEVNSETCRVSVPTGVWNFENSDLTEKLDNSDSENVEEFERRQKLNNPEILSRNVGDNSEWIPNVLDLYPKRLTSKAGGQRLEIYGKQLFPKGQDILAGQFIEVYLDNYPFGEGSLSNSDKYTCELNLYWSNSERIVCETTDKLPADRYKVRLRFYDDVTEKMVEGEVISKTIYTNCDEGCKVDAYQHHGVDSRIEQLNNRFVNAMPSDTSFWSEWFSRRDVEESEKSDQVRMYEVMRYFRGSLGHCRYPIDMQMRDPVNKTDLFDLAGLAYDIEPTVLENVLYDVDSSQSQVFSEFNKLDVEFRFLCDRNVMGIVGSAKDQSMPKTDNPSQGISIPKLVSSNDPSNQVGACALNNNGETFTNDLEKTTGKHTEFTFHCRMEVDANFHGGVQIIQKSDQHAQYILGRLGSDAGEWLSDVWSLTNDLSAVYNSYVAPAVTGISVDSCSKSGGVSVTITGNKFTEKPVVKVGFSDCTVTSFGFGQITCDIEEPQVSCPDSDKYRAVFLENQV